MGSVSSWGVIALGVLLAMAGFYWIGEQTALGWALVVSGFFMVYRCKRPIHHSLSQGVGIGLLALGVLTLVVQNQWADAPRLLQDLGLSLLLGGFALAAGKAGGWQGSLYCS